MVVTAYATIETAVEAMRRGAFDYLPKPFTPDQLRLVLERIAQLRRLQSQVEELEEQVRAVVPEVDLQTAEPRMRAGVGGGLQDRRQRGDDPAARRERHRQRGLRPGDPRPQPAAPPGPSSPSIAPASRPSCWRASCSGTSRGRSPARCGTRSARWRRRRAARFSWTKSATCRWPCSQSCCGCCKSGATSGWAKRRPGRATSASSRRRIAT